MIRFMDAIVADLRNWAEDLYEWGAEEQAKAVQRAASRVETRCEEALDARLTLEEAGGESGYSPDHLGRLVRQGTLPNAGERNAPLIRRRDLPRKPGYEVPVASPSPDPIGSKMQEAQAVVNSD